MTMTRRAFGRVTLGSFATSMLTSLPGNAQSQDPAAMLQRIDEIRLPQASFAVDARLKAYENGKLDDENMVTTYSRRGDSGQFLTIVHINEPRIDRGKLLLRNGNILWSYDPASKASVRISPRQRLLGNASNGDVISSNFVSDYSAAHSGIEKVVDGEKQEIQAHKLKLVATNDFAPYASIDLWAEIETLRPLKAKFYTTSGELLKVAWYRDWQDELGELRPKELVIADGFDPRNVTLMQLGSYSEKDLPHSWFRREWLPRFQK